MVVATAAADETACVATDKSPPPVFAVALLVAEFTIWLMEAVLTVTAADIVATGWDVVATTVGETDALVNAMVLTAADVAALGLLVLPKPTVLPTARLTDATDETPAVAAIVFATLTTVVAGKTTELVAATLTAAMEEALAPAPRPTATVSAEEVAVLTVGAARIDV